MIPLLVALAVVVVAVQAAMPAADDNLAELGFLDQMEADTKAWTAQQAQRLAAVKDAS